MQSENTETNRIVLTITLQSSGGLRVYEVPQTFKGYSAQVDAVHIATLFTRPGEKVLSVRVN